MFAAIALVLGASKFVAAQDGFTPLAERRFDYTALPYQADSDDGERGRQYGYNICNSTTEGPESLCQTAIINSLDDFCLWGPPHPDSLIGDTEGEAVAWCTKAGHGTRVIPEGAITGVQFIRTPDYIQVTGRITQELINIQADDSGGEMDPHGADRRGNPLGGLLFSTAYGEGYSQVIEWHNFMGGGLFCLKACDPSSADGPRFCEHIFDRIGCWYNAPAHYEEGVFESCVGENQDFPGIYTGDDGVVSTYTQPPEELGEISTMPYDPRRPATSQCESFESSALFAGAPQPSIRPSGSSTTTESPTSRPTTTRVRTSTPVESDGAQDDDGSSAGRVQIATGGLFAVAAAVIALL